MLGNERHNPEHSFALLVGVQWERAYESAGSRQSLNIVCRNLVSSPDNWARILSDCEEVMEDPSSKILLRLTPATLVRAASEKYGSYLFKLLSTLSQGRHAILLHQELLQGSLMWLEDDSMQYAPEGTPEDQLIFVPLSSLYPGYEPTEEDDITPRGLHFIRKSNLEVLMSKAGLSDDPELIGESIRQIVNHIRTGNFLVIPYRTNNQITTLTLDFIEGNLSEENTIRFFISSSLAERRDLTRLTELIREYCHNLGLQDIHFSRVETQLGTHIIFKVADGNALSRVEDVFQEFNKLFEACQSEPEQAARALAKAGVPVVQAQDICELLNREGKRLLLDAEMTRKKRLLELEHEIRSSVLEGRTPLGSSIQLGQESPAGLKDVVEGSVRIINNFHDRVTFNHLQASGDAQIQLLNLIQETSEGVEASALEADIAAMSDPEVPQRDKVSAYGRLRRFLSRHSGKIEELSLKLVATWLETKLKGQ